MRALLLLLLLSQAHAAGVNTHVAQGKYTAEQAQTALSNVGAESFRDVYYWSNLELTKGVLQPNAPLRELEKQIGQSRPLITLCCTNGKVYGSVSFAAGSEHRTAFINYVRWVATRFKGKVYDYELWNEWNIGASMYNGTRYGDPLLYADLLREVHATLKAVDPEIRVVAGSIAGWDDAWAEALLKTDAPMEAISIHPYAFPNIPEIHIDYLLRFQALVNKYRPGLPILLSEIGWPTFTGTQGVSDWKAGLYLSRFLLLLPQVSQVKGVWWYSLVNHGVSTTDREANFGLLRSDFTPKHSHCTMLQTHKILKTATFLNSTRYANGVQHVTYKACDGSYIHAVWAEKTGVTMMVTGGGVAQMICDGGKFLLGSKIYVGLTPTVIRGDANITLQ
jgi:hypothetical protein